MSSIFEPFGTDSDLLSLSLKLLVSGFCGGLIGIEREYYKKPAGLRTNILICTGCALLVNLSIGFVKLGGVTDPSRIAAQVISGIGFLGAGAILHSKGNVVGLTTAATVWSVAGIGMAIGAGFFAESILFTVFVIIIMTAIKPVEHWISHRCHVNEYSLRIKELYGALPLIQKKLNRSHIWHQRPNLEVKKIGDSYEIQFHMCQTARAHREFENEIIEIADSYNIRRGN